MANWEIYIPDEVLSSHLYSFIHNVPLQRCIELLKAQRIIAFGWTFISHKYTYSEKHTHIQTHTTHASTAYLTHIVCVFDALLLGSVYEYFGLQTQIHLGSDGSI